MSTCPSKGRLVDNQLFLVATKRLYKTPAVGLAAIPAVVIATTPAARPAVAPAVGLAYFTTFYYVINEPL